MVRIRLHFVCPRCHGTRHGKWIKAALEERRMWTVLAAHAYGAPEKRIVCHRCKLDWKCDDSRMVLEIAGLLSDEVRARTS